MEKENNSNRNNGLVNWLKNSPVGRFFDRAADGMSENMKKRVGAAMVLVPIVIFLIYYSHNLFNLLILAMAILMAFEWFNIVKSDETNRIRWQVLGLIYILAPCFSLVVMRGMPKGDDIILWLFASVWATDTAAMLVGKSVGGPKLMPAVSPNKTWSGLLGGMLASGFVGLVASLIFSGTMMFFTVFGLILGAVEQASDLLESKLKRHFGVKDSGNIIPGHGGILDRVDGFTLTAPLVLLLAIFAKGIFA